MRLEAEAAQAQYEKNCGRKERTETKAQSVQDKEAKF